MAKDRPTPPTPAAPTPPAGRVARLRARLAKAPAVLRRHPLESVVAGAVLVAAIIGVVWGGALMFRPPNAAERVKLLTVALARLDEGELNQAKRLAAELHALESITYPERGGPLFIQGVVTLEEARAQVEPIKRRALFLIAARYLEEARSHGWPRGRANQGMVYLGQALHDGGRYADSLPILSQALAADPAAKPLVLPLLTDSCLHTTPPRLAQALAYNIDFLALPNLAEADLHSGQLVQSRILLDQKQFEAAWKTAASVPPSAEHYPAALVLQGEIALAAWRSGLPAPAGNEFSAQHLVEQLQKLLERRELLPEIVAQAELLIGLAQEQIPDATAAAKQYERVETTYFGRPEAVAAAVFHASLLVPESPTAAVELFQRALSPDHAEALKENIWLPESVLQQRIERAVDQLLAKESYPLALSLAQATPPALPRVQSRLDELRIHRAWAETLEERAAGQRLAESEVTLAEARQQWREAGATGHQLAELRFATRQYLDDLTGAARDFLRGQGYRQAAQILEQVVQQESRTGRPEALIGLAEAQLALGDTAAALTTLSDCLEAYPEHPASYRARWLTSQVLLEQGEVDRSRELLLDNLYRHALTPQSNEWRDSLFAYGFLLYRQGVALETQSRLEGIDQPDLTAKQPGLALLEQSYAAFQQAIKVLSEAVQRYPEAAETIRARYSIAESYRHSAKWPRKRLGTITIETTRVALNRQLQEELLAALEHYGSLIAQLGDGQDAEKKPTEVAILRNCYFGRADALFDLGRYEEAVRAYSAATNRYQHEPESLEAYVQIAACLRRLDRAGEARGTLEQARIVLQRLRSDADFTRTTRYNRDEWTQLLAWLRTL